MDQSGARMSSSVDGPVGVLGQRLRLGPGLLDEDRDRVLGVLAALDRHLAPWKPEHVRIRGSVRHRGEPSQRVTLEVLLPAWPTLIASCDERDLDRALVEVRKDVIRKIEDERERRRQHEMRAARDRTA
jgi:hypothetical protein